MKIGTIPSFKDVFPDEELIPLNLLLRDIPSVSIIEILTQVNSKLHFYGVGSKKIDSEILGYFLQRFSYDQKVLVTNNLRKFFSNRENPGAIFTLYGNLKIIENEISSYKVGYRNLIGEDYFKIFKAVLVVHEDFDIEQGERTKDIPNSDKVFYKYFWPISFAQSDMLLIRNFISLAFKGKQFLNFIENNYRNYLNEFLKYYNIENANEYIKKLIKIYMDASKFHEFKVDESFESTFFVDKFSMSVDDFREIKIEPDFKSLRLKPLIKFQDKYFVINWNFVLDKLYQGLRFDFYNNTSISSNFNSKKPFNEYCAIFSDSFAEKKLFLKILQEILYSKYSYYKSGDKNSSYDFYYRKGNNIIIFEFKDIIPPANLASDYAQIEKWVDNNLVFKKGIAQLFNTITQIQKDVNEIDPNLDNTKIKNLKIFPVLVFTHSSLDAPGLSYYLQDSLKKKMGNSNLSFLVKELCMINLDTFVQFYDDFKSNKVSLIDLLKDYSNNFKRKIKKHSSTKNVDDFTSMHLPSDNLLRILIHKRVPGITFSRSLLKKIIE